MKDVGRQVGIKGTHKLSEVSNDIFILITKTRVTLDLYLYFVQTKVFLQPFDMLGITEKFWRNFTSKSFATLNMIYSGVTLFD